MKSVNRTVMDALDDLTDNLELKDVLTYFGYLDLGKCFGEIFQDIKGDSKPDNKYDLSERVL